MGVGVDDKRLEGIYQAALGRRERRERLRREAPLVRLWDGDWNLRGRVKGEYSSSFEWKLNDTGAGQIDLPYDHHLARWAGEYWNRKKQNIHVTVDKDGARWSGRCREVTTTMDAAGVRTVTLHFLHDYEELKHISVWPNPFTPAVVQFPKIFMLAGPSITVLKIALFLNLFRLQGNLWRLPDDPLSFKGWTQGLNYKEWPILVKPSSVVLDDSQWTVIASRMKTWHDMAQVTLGDGQLAVECRRWLPGDEQPWFGAGLYRPGQLVVDIVDKSGWWSQTAVGGTIAGGLVRTGLTVADNLVDEARFALEQVSESPEYGVSGFLGVSPKNPWVVYRTEGEQRTAETTSFTWKPATVGQITVGGKSMPGVNEGISAAVQLSFDTMANFLFLPAAGGAVDSLLKPLYEDVLMAFMSLKSPLRTMSLGWSHYYEDFSEGSSSAWTLSAIIALRTGFYNTRQQTSHSFTVGDGAPYLIGDKGQGHFFLGDRVGAEVPGARAGRVVVDQCTGLRLSWDASKPHEWEITIGQATSVVDDPLAHALERIKDMNKNLHDLGVF
ncbi:phage tail protein [Corynebacterium heidelbergense]|uniref:Gp37-like protein n=1 Tax=Corynebacterium heidelbergense TaxID=2055947 RepID=UPI000DD82B1C|nr:phage tail protein [Corynebacterium heidelbergense]WCZ36067.1 hypothetical protein CHEID_02505 [Corynebacterium heidelbergense]